MPIFMRYASSVIIVPGYGLAVAQGQQKLYEFVKLLQARVFRQVRGPSSGRRDACQMDVLLLSGVPYDMIFPARRHQRRVRQHDVALVIGQ